MQIKLNCYHADFEANRNKASIFDSSALKISGIRFLCGRAEAMQYKLCDIIYNKIMLKTYFFYFFKNNWLVASKPLTPFRFETWISSRKR